MNVEVGTSLPELVVEADPARMKVMALILKDPNPIHWDIDSVERLGLGSRPINQGPNNLAYVINMLTQWSGGYEHLRDIRVRFLDQVYAGERVIAKGTVKELTPLDAATSVALDVSLEKEDGTLVLAGTATLELPSER